MREILLILAVSEKNERPITMVPGLTHRLVPVSPDLPTDAPAPLQSERHRLGERFRVVARHWAGYIMIMRLRPFDLFFCGGQLAQPSSRNVCNSSEL